MNTILHDISWVVPLRNEFLTSVFEFFTWLGYPTFILLLLPLIYWAWSKDRVTRVAIIVVVSTVLNAFLKDLWENPRPDLLFRLDGEVGNSFGMPSGHAQVSAVLWFWLAYEIKKTWAWLVATIIVLGICCSRLYLGIHDLEDILAGLALAVISLLIFRLSLMPVFRSIRSWPLLVNVAAIAVLAIVVRLAWPAPAHSIGAFVAVGLLVSWLIGACVEPRYVGFAPRREVWSLILIAVIGVSGLFIMLAITKPMLTVLDPMIGGVIRSALLGIYMTLLAPLLFKLCKLDAASQPV